jgi:hypothetical protein
VWVCQYCSFSCLRSVLTVSFTACHLDEIPNPPYEVLRFSISLWTKMTAPFAGYDDENWGRGPQGTLKVSHNECAKAIRTQLEMLGAKVTDFDNAIYTAARSFYGYRSQLNEYAEQIAADLVIKEGT